MDDFENKNLDENNLPEEESAAAASDSSGESPTSFEDGLVTELEGIRDLLQTELDKAEEAEQYAPGELIQELDEIDETAVDEGDREQPPKKICECCGENECDTSFGEDYPYCSECRKLMTASPAHVGGIVMFVVMILVGLVSFIFLSSDGANSLMSGKLGEALTSAVTGLNEYTDLINADASYSEGKIVDACLTYGSYIQQYGGNDSISAVAVKRLVEIYYDLGQYNYASTVIEQYSDKVPSLKKGKYAEIGEFYKSYSATITALEPILGEIIQSDTKFNYNKKSKELDALLEKGTDENGTAYSAFTVEYYRYALMQKAGKDLEEQLKQLLKVEEIDKGEHSSYYLPTIITTYSKLGDTENAKKYFEMSLKKNLQDDNAYIYYANVFRFCEKPDADKILEVADLAKKNWPTSSQYPPTYQSIYALGYLLKGDGENAFKAISAYVDSGFSISTATGNLYALCAAYVKDDESYQKIADLFANYSLEIDSNVQKYKKGKLTIEQVLTDVGGDI